jgi:NitT/TauT family transport system substrate-binding protein
MKYLHCCLFSIVLALSFARSAIAEVTEVRIAQQYGFSYLQLMYMEKHRLLETHARAAGLGEVKVSWTQFAGGNAMNDALLSGSLDFASGGVAPPIVLWSKTVGGLGVKMVAAMTSAPLLLNTSNPNIKSLKDFTDKDKIALPAVKVSNQATILAMAAAQQLGKDNAHSLNRLTVSMSHPDGMVALLNGQISAHFTAPPYQGQELKDARIHTILNSYDVMGGPLTFTVVWATTKFKNENPKIYAAFVAALKQATDMINRDKRAAAEFYVAESKSKEPVDEVYRMIADPAIEFTLTPLQIGKYAAFMYDSDLIKLKPGSWKDLFFENVHALPGS